MQVHRAVRHLNNLVKRYPNISRQVDEVLRQRGKDLPDWPGYCLIPLAGWAYIAMQQGVRNHRALVADATALGAIGAWRYSQGIYRVDPELLTALANTPITGTLPSGLLLRQEAWSLYIETPGMTLGGKLLHGFWMHPEFDVGHQQPELGLVLDCDDGMFGIGIHIGNWTLTEAIERANQYTVRSAPSVPADWAARAVASLLSPVMSIVLYICSDQPDIDDVRHPGRGPTRPAPRKTQTGWRMFPADRPAYFDVGARIGAKLRQAREAFARVAAETGRTVCPHFRRAHWHGFWSGPRVGERVFKVKWLPPVLVANVEPAEPENIAA